MAWWLGWRNAARDHETSCVSCHTAVPYALARPALRAVLTEPDPPAPERRLLDNVVKRVRMWREVEPFYPDQTVGLPKTSESRGTEAVLNALILARRDAASGDPRDAAHRTLSDDARLAFDNLWVLQLRTGDQKGSWAWLNFHYEPWESTASPYFGAALAAIAIGTAPEGYASRPEIQERLNMLLAYLQRGADTEHLFNRMMVLWASSALPSLLTSARREAIVGAVLAQQEADGGWSTSALGPWKRVDGTALDAASDGYATGLAVLVLRRGGLSSDDGRLRRGLDWLAAHQDAETGMWRASSLNKSRDPTSDIGKFMSDAATAYAVLALTSP
jgi:squalene-hopene/tetraprenyl-beta-curcumene cyclase